MIFKCSFCTFLILLLCTTMLYVHIKICDKKSKIIQKLFLIGLLMIYFIFRTVFKKGFLYWNISIWLYYWNMMLNIQKEWLGMSSEFFLFILTFDAQMNHCTVHCHFWAFLGILLRTYLYKESRYYLYLHQNCMIKKWNFSSHQKGAKKVP